MPKTGKGKFVGLSKTYKKKEYMTNRIQKAVKFFLTCEDSEIKPKHVRAFADLVYEYLRCPNCKTNFKNTNYWCDECKQTLPDPKKTGTVAEMQEKLLEWGKERRELSEKDVVEAMK